MQRPNRRGIQPHKQNHDVAAVVRYTTSLAAAPAMNADFASAARRVRTRVMLRRWLALLERTLWPVCGLLLVMTALAWRGGYGLIALIAGAWLLWKAATLLVTWLRRPGEYSALALWDAATGRREALRMRGGLNPARRFPKASAFTSRRKKPRSRMRCPLWRKICRCGPRARCWCRSPSQHSAA